LSRTNKDKTTLYTEECGFRIGSEYSNNETTSAFPNCSKLQTYTILILLPCNYYLISIDCDFIFTFTALHICSRYLLEFSIDGSSSSSQCDKISESPQYFDLDLDRKSTIME
jgi:hypothetical protein